MALKFYLKSIVRPNYKFILCYIFTVCILNVGSLFASGLTTGNFKSKSNSAKVFATSPVVKAFYPASAGSGTTVTIVGTSFTGATAVQFGGTNALSYTVVNSSVIVAVVADGSSGSVSVTRGFTGSLAGFTYTKAPFITYPSALVYVINTTISNIIPSNTGGSIPTNTYGLVSTFAGNGTEGVTNGVGTAASFSLPFGIGIDPYGNFYVSDSFKISHSDPYNYVRKIAPDGTVSYYAGIGTPGNSNAYRTSASFDKAIGLAVDPFGDVYVGEVDNQQVRKIASDGTVTTLANNSSGIQDPSGLASDLNGNVYVADGSSNVIRKITYSGVVSTFAGSGSPGSTDGIGVKASFNHPYGLAIDQVGNLYVADAGNNLIRKISITDGAVSTFAGTGQPGHNDGNASSATFNYPIALVFDPLGNLYVGDYSNSRIRIISPTGVVSTLAGNGSYTAVNGIGTAASFDSPVGLTTDYKGNLYVTENQSNLVRKISITGYSISPALPAGMSFDPTTGTISGKPTTTLATTTYTVTAYNLAGSSTSTFTLEVLPKFIWTGGGGDNNWNTGKNWDVGSSPTDGSVVLFNNNKTNTVNIPAGTNINLNSLTVGGSKGTTTTLVEGSSKNTFTASNISVISNSALQFTSGILTFPNTYNTGSFTINNSTAQLDNLIIDTVGVSTFTNNSKITLRTYLNVNTTCKLSINSNSSLNLSYDDNYNIAYFENNGTVNSSASTFNFTYNVSEGYGAANEIDNYGTFNDVGSTFNLDGTNSQIINNSYSNFNCNGSTFNCDGGIYGYTGIYSLNSILNNGVFLALGTTQIILSGNGSNLLNYTPVEANTAYFVLGPKSSLDASGTNSAVQNVDSYIPESYYQGYFILNSDHDNSAFVHQSSSSNGFIGQYNVQRYFTGNNSLNYRGYRLVSSPVNITSETPATSYDALNYIDYRDLNQTYTPNYAGAIKYNGIATGGSGTGFTYKNTNPLLYLYNETYDPSNASTSFTASKYAGITSVYSYQTTEGYPSVDWVTTSKGAPVPSGNVQIPVGNGLGLYYVGPNTRSNLSSTVAPDSSIVTFYGYINQGNIDVYPWFAHTSNKLSYTTTAIKASVFFPGTNLVGNPYPATIDLRMVQQDNPNITNFAELDDVAPHGYVLYGWDGKIETTQGSSASRYIASGQGFFVTVKDEKQTLTFKEDQKVYNTSLLTAKSKPPGLLVNSGGSTINQNNKSLAINTPTINDLSSLHLKLTQDSLNFRETGIYFNKKWDDNFGNGDALDLDGLGLKIFLSSYTTDGARVGINTLNNYISGKKIKIYVKATLDGTYNLQISDITNIDQSLMNVYLVDNFKKDSVDLVANPVYSFSIVNADTTTYGANRFALSIQRKPYQLLSFNAAKSKNNITVNWQTKFEGDFTGFGLQKLNTISNKYITIDSLQSNGAGSYAFNDPSATTGENTYRLAQNNINGAVTYSTPVTIKYGLLSLPTTLGIFPNPVIDNVLFDFSGLVTNPSGTYTIQVYNSLGVLLLENTSNTNFLNTNLSSLRSGIYIVHIKNATGNIIGKSTFIKN